MHIVAIIISSAILAPLLLGAASLGGPTWGILPVMLVEICWLAFAIFAVGMTAVEMLIVMSFTAIILLICERWSNAK